MVANPAVFHQQRGDADGRLTGNLHVRYWSQPDSLSLDSYAQQLSLPLWANGLGAETI